MEEILRLQKSFEMGGEKRRERRQRKLGNREARPPYGRLATEAISIARRCEEGERKVEEEILLLVPFTRALTRQNCEVIDFTRSHVKHIPKLTNLMKITQIEGYNGK